MTDMDDIQKKIKEELKALQKSNVATKTDAQLANYENMTGQEYSDEWHQKQKEAQQKRKESGWSSKMIGNTNGRGNKGQKRGPQTEESNAKRSATLMGRKIPSITGVPKPKVTCPHCGKTGGKPQMIQYHFDKCKLKGKK
jgi:uncharacterized protein YdaU (DUF1376 family)